MVLALPATLTALKALATDKEDAPGTQQHAEVLAAHAPVLCKKQTVTIKADAHGTRQTARGQQQHAAHTAQASHATLKTDVHGLLHLNAEEPGLAWVSQKFNANYTTTVCGVS